MSEKCYFDFLKILFPYSMFFQKYVSKFPIFLYRNSNNQAKSLVHSIIEIYIKNILVLIELCEIYYFQSKFCLIIRYY